MEPFLLFTAWQHLHEYILTRENGRILDKQGNVVPKAGFCPPENKKVFQEKHPVLYGCLCGTLEEKEAPSVPVAGESW